MASNTRANPNRSDKEGNSSDTMTPNQSEEHEQKPQKHESSEAKFSNHEDDARSISISKATREISISKFAPAFKTEGPSNHPKTTAENTPEVAEPLAPYAESEEFDSDSELDLESFELDPENIPMYQQLLIDAMRLHDRRSVLKVLTLGIDVNSEFEENREKKSMLFYAVDSGSLEMVKLLLEQGAEMRPSSDPETRMAYPLHHAAAIGNMPIIKYFVEELGLNINYLEADGMTPLHAAARSGILAVVQYFLERGAHVNASTKDDTMPIHFAAARGYHQIMDELVRRGADVNAVQVRYDVFDKKNDRMSCLILAACCGSYNVCEYLCMHGAHVDWRDNGGWTALHNAACFNYPYIVDLLIKHGANVNLKSKEGDSPIHAAVHGDRIKTVLQLFKGGADINASNEKGNSAIYESASRYNCSSTWALLDCGVILNTPKNIRSFSETVIGMKLHEKIDLKDVIRLMLEAGAIIETEWLLTLSGSYIVRHCLSLNRMYRHITIPRTLQSCCHLVIRKHIKKPISENLCHLPLPQKVQDEICLKNYVIYRPSSWRWGGDSLYWRKSYSY